jgi:uncharacterized protein YdhG (YjbR/CyaY superfamily)
MIYTSEISTYLDNLQPLAKKAVIEALDALVSSFPKVDVVISYGVIALKYEKIFTYLGGFKNHISIFPPLTENKSLINKTKKYRNKKGNLIFKLDQPIPFDLIIQVAKGLKKQYGQ